MTIENPLVLPQRVPAAPAPAAASERRAAQPPLLIPLATPEGRATPPAPLSTVVASSGRVTSATVASVNEGGLAWPRLETRGGFSISSVSLADQMMFTPKMHDKVRCAIRQGQRPTKLYLLLCWVKGKLRGSNGQQRLNCV